MAEPLLPEEARTERDALRAVAAGEPSAVDGWYRREHPCVYRLCFGFLADEAEAEDTAQDAMLHLLDRLDRRDATRPYRAWRNAVVTNLCRDRLRRRLARRRAEEGAAQALETRGERGAASPAAELDAGETRELLRRALRALTPREREAFVLRDLEGSSTQEVAEALGVEAASVRSLLTLARRRLRGLLARRMTDADPGGGDA